MGIVPKQTVWTCSGGGAGSETKQMDNKMSIQKTEDDKMNDRKV